MFVCFNKKKLASSVPFTSYLVEFSLKMKLLLVLAIELAHIDTYKNTIMS